MSPRGPAPSRPAHDADLGRPYALALPPRSPYSPAVRFRILLPLLLALPGTQARAQTPPVQGTQTDSCALGRINFIYIDSKSIFDLDDPDLSRRFRWAARAANALHMPTREWVIRRELLFGPGSCFDPFLINESERLLRAYPFLSRVTITGSRQPDGSYDVHVATTDEWSTRLDLRVKTAGGLGLEGLRVSEENVLGTGQALGFFYYEREATRDYGVSYFTPQLLGTRWDLETSVGRTRAGTFFREEVSYPFVGEVSRWAGRQSFRREDQFFDYVAADDPGLRSDHVVVPIRQQNFDLAIVRRIGDRGNTAMIGTALSFEELSYPGVVQIAREGDYDRRETAPDSLLPPVLQQRHNLDNIRIFALLGHRNVWWRSYRGMDSMRGQEDVRLGAEAILGVGRSLPSLEADDDIYSMLALYAGMQIGDVLVVGRGRADARRDLSAATGEPELKDVYVQNEILAYLQTRLLPRQTLFLRAAMAGGWNTRTPFQLTLGGETGLRGYDRERMPGGRRLVLSVEDRFYIGWPLPDLVDVGGTVFTDVGRIWPGDAPFGADSGWRASAGFGVRASFPAGGRSTYRVDVAWPLEAGTGVGDFRLTLTVGEPRGLHSRAVDRQLVRSRTQDVGGELFTFRN
jgi:hypothetical protein